jgi:hypothetical protein
MLNEIACVTRPIRKPHCASLFSQDVSGPGQRTLAVPMSKVGLGRVWPESRKAAFDRSTATSRRSSRTPSRYRSSSASTCDCLWLRPAPRASARNRLLHSAAGASARTERGSLHRDSFDVQHHSDIVEQRLRAEAIVRPYFISSKSPGFHDPSKAGGSGP